MLLAMEVFVQHSLNSAWSTIEATLRKSWTCSSSAEGLNPHKDPEAQVAATQPMSPSIVVPG